MENTRKRYNSITKSITKNEVEIYFANETKNYVDIAEISFNKWFKCICHYFLLEHDMCYTNIELWNKDFLIWLKEITIPVYCKEVMKCNVREEN